MTDLTGKIVLVTGASSGIGESCARKFASAGAKLILAARRMERLERLAGELGVDCHLLQLDVRNRAEVERSISGLPKEWMAIDVLVNNAGLSRGLSKLQEGKIEGWEEMIDTNIKGLLYISRAVLPGMVRRNSGHVINIGSIAGREVYPNGNVYCATKHAVDAITKGMRLDLVETKVRVTTVDPGLVETEFSEIRFWGDTVKASTVYHGFQPLTGADVAESVVWAATQPEHVTIAEILILPTAQASSTLVNKSAD
ncbi:MAG: SDR family oxidoreductase [bacterium]|nr:SDR family oxidoreductase [bacterium]